MADCGWVTEDKTRMYAASVSAAYILSANVHINREIYISIE
mgnify:FL=1